VFGGVKYIHDDAIGSVGFYCHLNTSFGNQHKIMRNKIKIRPVQSHLNDPNYPIFLIMSERL